MDSHRNARLTPKGREQAMRRDEWRAKLRRCRPQVQHDAEDGRQMGQMLSAQKAWMGCVTAPQDRFIGQPNSASHMRRHRGLAPTALHRKAHRSRSWRLAATVCRVHKRRRLSKLSALGAGRTFGQPASVWAGAKSSSGPTRPRPMARLSASSKPHYANRLKRGLISTPISDQKN